MDNLYPTVKAFYNEIKDDNNHRFKSWEHCYNYFSQDKSAIELEKACLHLAFYLASWGMYRGSSGLLWKDYMIHQEVVELLLKDEYKSLQNSTTFEDDVVGIISVGNEIRTIYTGKNINASDTLVTKILLGTLGCVPAYDRFFKDALTERGIRPKTFGKKSLLNLYKFTEENRVDIEKLMEEINYPKMKIIDMYFWQTGYEQWLKEKNNKDNNGKV